MFFKKKVSKQNQLSKLNLEMVSKANRTDVKGGVMGADDWYTLPVCPPGDDFYCGNITLPVCPPGDDFYCGGMRLM